MRLEYWLKYFMLFIVAIVLLVLGVFVTEVNADFQTKFTNNSKGIKVVLFSWVDHPYNTRNPVNIIGAELKPGKSFCSKVYRKPGIYIVQFYSRENSIIGRIRVSADVVFIEFINSEKDIAVMIEKEKEAR